MTRKRFSSGLLTLGLLALLGWCVVSNAGDLRTRVMLGAGVLLGIVYTIWGRLPDWLLERSGGYLSADDAPSNIPARVYLPIILGAILLAALVIVIFVYLV